MLYRGKKMGKLIDLTGQKFNHLEVLYKDNTRNEDCACWICRCDVCGRLVSMKSNKLKSLRQQTCGCGHPMKDVQGQSRDRLYGIWIKMKHRCYNPKAGKYRRYGARGIKICNEWLNDYDTFRNWALQNGYSDKLTIERIDNNDDYCPENCRWATWKEQAQNTCRTVRITVDGITKNKSEWAEILNKRNDSATKTIINKLKDKFEICKWQILKEAKNWNFK